LKQRRHFYFVFMLLAAFCFAALPADARTGDSKKTYKSSSLKKGKKVAKRSRSYSEPKYAAVVVDAETGQVLYEENAGNTRFPASLTKMMTLYLTFDAIKQGKFTLDSILPVSEKAAGQPQTNIALNAGDRLPVRSAIESLVVRSANDSAMVLAEALGGTEWNFGLMMTKKAHELGMKDTVFRNPSGLPDNKQRTTAYDMARMGIALKRDFPEYYPYFSLTSFTYNGVEYPSHNKVMERYPGADGIKTGYTRASGFNLVTSAKRAGRHLVAVVMGGKTATKRDSQMVSLLDRTFAKLENKANQMAANDNDDRKPNLFAEEKDSDSAVMTAQGGNF